MCRSKVHDGEQKRERNGAGEKVASADVANSFMGMTSKRERKMMKVKRRSQAMTIYDEFFPYQRGCTGEKRAFGGQQF
jgi:hypothetical protein